jgi:hypothetical protein
MQAFQKICRFSCAAIASLVLALPAVAGTASSVPAQIAGAVLVNNAVAVKGNPLTYSTQVPLSANSVYYVYVAISPGMFNGVPNPATVLTSNNAVLQTALQGATGTLSTAGTFVVYRLASTAATVPVDSTISFTPQGAAGNDGSVNGLANLSGGGVVSEQISIGSSQNLSTVMSDIDTAAGGNVIIFEGSPPPATACGLSLQTGYWWNPNESGRGYYLEQQGNVLYFAAFMYSNTGEATWYESSGALANTMATSGAFCNFSNALYAYANGQTFGGTYAPPSAPTMVSNFTLGFYDATHASINWGSGITTDIQRFPIVTNGLASLATSAQPQTGFWWNPSEPGRGYTLEIQSNEMFYAGFMYDTSGNPVWYATGPQILATQESYVGNFTQFCCGQVLFGSYKAAGIAVADVGSTTLQFSSQTAGTMTYPNGKQIPIQRFVFALPNALPDVSVTLAGNGTGTVTSNPAGISCGSACSEGYAVGTQVTLTPSASAGSGFAGWTGACTGTGSCVVTAGANTSVGAIFTLAGSTAIGVTVTGPGTVTSSPAGISCTQFGGTTCSASFALNTVVTLTATPNSDGSVFSHWAGDCAIYYLSGTCTISSNSASSVQAVFLPPTAIQGY